MSQLSVPPTARPDAQRSTPARPPAGQASWLPFLVLVAVVLVVRVGWAGWAAHHDPLSVRSPDTASYVDSARALVEDSRFNRAPGDDTPMIIRTPGYPLFLSEILWLSGDSDWALSPVQAALSVSILALTYWLGRRILTPAGALVATAIVALDPLQFAASGTILTEAAASVAMLVIAIAGWRVFAQRRGSADLVGFALLGLAVAAATFIRPTTYYFPVLVAIFIILATRRLGGARVLACLAAFAIPLVILVGGWQLRNHERVDTWRFSAVDSYNLYCYRAPEVASRANGTTFATERAQRGCDRGRKRVNEKNCPTWWERGRRDLANPGPCYDEMAARGTKTLVSHPIETGIMTAKGFVRLTLGPGTDTVGRYLGVSNRALSVLLGAWILALWVAFAVGVAAVVRRKHDDRLLWAFVLASIGYVLIISSGTEGYARLRSPVVPLIALVAGAAWPQLCAWAGRLTSSDRAPGTPRRASAAP